MEGKVCQAERVANTNSHPQGWTEFDLRCLEHGFTGGQGPHQWLSNLQGTLGSSWRHFWLFVKPGEGSARYRRWWVGARDAAQHLTMYRTAPKCQQRRCRGKPGPDHAGKRWPRKELGLYPGCHRLGAGERRDQTRLQIPPAARAGEGKQRTAWGGGGGRGPKGWESGPSFDVAVEGLGEGLQLGRKKGQHQVRFLEPETGKPPLQDKPAPSPTLGNTPPRGGQPHRHSCRAPATKQSRKVAAATNINTSISYQEPPARRHLNRRWVSPHGLGRRRLEPAPAHSAASASAPRLPGNAVPPTSTAHLNRPPWT